MTDPLVVRIEMSCCCGGYFLLNVEKEWWGCAGTLANLARSWADAHARHDPNLSAESAAKADKGPGG